MPALDTIHDAVRNALIKDGWTILEDPYTIEYETDRFYADLRAEQILAAEQAGRVIVVEIKSFMKESLMRDLEESFGQYEIYRRILCKVAPDYRLYLAISDIAYNKLKTRPTFRLLIEEDDLALIVVNTTKEEIVEWIH
jgi:hypothetical protein